MLTAPCLPTPNHPPAPPCRSFYDTNSNAVTTYANDNVTSVIVRQPSLGGDINEDGFIDINDLAMLALHWLQHVTGGDSVGDFNHDGIVDINDVAIQAVNWQRTDTVTWAVAERFVYDSYGNFMVDIRAAVAMVRIRTGESQALKVASHLRFQQEAHQNDLTETHAL